MRMAILIGVCLVLCVSFAADAADKKPGSTAPIKQGAPTNSGTPNYGYGRSWCYWHPYLCH